MRHRLFVGFLLTDGFQFCWYGSRAGVACRNDGGRVNAFRVIVRGSYLLVHLFGKKIRYCLRHLIFPI